MRLMHRRSARFTGLLGIVLAAGSALAGPPVLDRVPENSGIVIAVPSLTRFQAATRMLNDTLQFDAGDEGPLKELTKLLSLDGLNKDGSAAMAIIPGPDGKLDFDAPEPPMVVVVPVSDYTKFITGLGGKAGAVSEFAMPGEEAKKGFAKDLGGGYAGLAETRETLESFKGDAGHAGAHERLLGPVGKAVADNADILFIANLPALEPKLREGAEQMHQEMENAAMMTGQEMGGAILMMDTITGGLLRDGQSGVIAMAAKESGFHVDFAAQFKEGSPTAAYFDSKGSATALLSKVPNKPFLFAMGLDTTGPGVKRFFKQAAELSMKAQGDQAAPGMMGSMLKTIDTMEGVAFEWGAVPALMGGAGLFTNTVAFVKTPNAAGYTASMQETFAEMNGKTMQGFQYQTAYKAGSKDVGGVKADEWSMRMIADPNDPNAQQMQMVTMGLFGMEGGPSGYIAPAGGGVVLTYSKNSAIMEEGLKAAGGGEGLGADPGIKMVSGMLPADRTLEAYIGVKSILDAVGSMGMLQADIPEDLPPIGISGTLNHGGVRFAWFVPAQVVKTIRSLGGDEGGMDEDAGN